MHSGRRETENGGGAGAEAEAASEVLVWVGGFEERGGGSGGLRAALQSMPDCRVVRSVSECGGKQRGGQVADDSKRGEGGGGGGSRSGGRGFAECHEWQPVPEIAFNPLSPMQVSVRTQAKLNLPNQPLIKARTKPQ
jgi:hypothetical protein